MARETFGINPEELTVEELEKEIKIHEKTVSEGKVGTPNVYVRLADLKRELEKREATPSIEVFDNHGKLADGKKVMDRYTVIIGNDVYLMSANPCSPQGMNQYACGRGDILRWENVGDKVEIKSLPEEVKKAIAYRMGENEKLPLEELEGLLEYIQNYLPFKNELSLTPEMTIGEYCRELKKEMQYHRNLDKLEGIT
jgi:hypothetical protein